MFLIANMSKVLSTLDPFLTNQWTDLAYICIKQKFIKICSNLLEYSRSSYVHPLSQCYTRTDDIIETNDYFESSNRIVRRK